MIAHEGETEVRRTKRKKRLRSGDVLVVVIVAVFLLIFALFDFSQIFGFLFRPLTGLILLLIIVEFLILKSGDRTRVYRIEIDRLRKERRTLEDSAKDAAKLLEIAREKELAEGKRFDDRWHKKADQLIKEVEERF